MTEAIEDKLGSTNENGTNETDEIEERTLDFGDANDNIRDNTDGRDFNTQLNMNKGNHQLMKGINIVSQMNTSHLAIEEEEQDRQPTHN